MRGPGVRCIPCEIHQNLILSEGRREVARSRRRGIGENHICLAASETFPSADKEIIMSVSIDIPGSSHGTTGFVPSLTPIYFG